MGSLRYFWVLLFLTIFSSCAKTSYLFEQGSGQLSLLWNAEDNEELLKDQMVSEEVKQKIKLIKKYKNYFYKYWSKEPSDIYSKTTILKDKAVTHLVISSKFYEIKPAQECFPFMGCFPYIGFFSKESAKNYRLDKEREDFVTYQRPVYAYSTLGYFTDTILSSFFYFKDVELAELIFHELFHTIFFAKDEVELNENLANFFSEKMVEEYFENEPQLQLIKNQREKNKILKKNLVDLVKQLNTQYLTSGGKKLSKAKAQELKDYFMKNVFNPKIEDVCAQNKIDNCYPLKREWNNASFAAFMTYENKANRLELLQNKLNLDLKSFYRYIEDQYESYRKNGDNKSFAGHLFKKL